MIEPRLATFDCGCVCVIAAIRLLGPNGLLHIVNPEARPGGHNDGTDVGGLADPRFETALNGVETSATMEDLQVALERLIAAYGLKQVVYHALHIPPASIRQSALVHTYPADWVSHYADRRYYNIDPVVLESERSIMPFDWSGLDRTAKPVQRMFNESLEAGIGRQGITIPIRGSFGERALFTVTSDVADADWARLRVLYLRDMQLIASYAHSRVLAIKGLKLPDYASRLSRRERECLLWAASGKTASETAQILTLSSSVVRVYLDSARHKLDCATKTQAVARAISLSIISV